LRAASPAWAAFLEVGVEVAKGLDPVARAWAAAGAPTTYHFLDVNLDDVPGDGGDLDETWLAGLRALVHEARPAWLCGDAGLWHFGARDRGHMLLLPPILLPEAVGPMAAGIRALRGATGLEVLPENPPGAAFVGPMHLLEFFGQVAEAADTGLLIDCAHLLMFQQARGLDLFAGFEHLPLDRVVELHIAGGRPADHEGLATLEDDHGLEVQPGTWALARTKSNPEPSCMAQYFVKYSPVSTGWGRSKNQPIRSERSESL
jgi:uncharacterized protein (UPF0276 family)